jgi:lipase maturation factor 1
LLCWLLFRLVFESGCVKWLAGDTTWRQLAALNFHYETQPLPTWLGWYAHQMPGWFQKSSVVAMFEIELIAPFLIFAPRHFRLVGCLALVMLQGLILITGNYCFFNLLTIALCLLLIDDLSWLTLLPARWRRWLAGAWSMPEWLTPLPADETPASLPPNARQPTHKMNRGWRWPTWALGPLAAIILLVTGCQLMDMFGLRAQWLDPAWKLYAWVAPLRSINSYGLFRVMTTSRPEIVVEGSNDRTNWLAYEFKFKPGDVNRRPAFVEPHQPRLDWQMWFAALGTYRQNPWFIQFCLRLLQGSPEVLALLDKNPFPGAPPRYVRAVVYDYHFTDFATRRATGAWWRRDFKGLYCPVLTLREEK